MTTSLIHQPSGSWQKSPWLRLATLILIFGFLFVRPKVDAWLNGNDSPGEPSVADSEVADSPPTGKTATSQSAAPGSGSDEASSPTASDSGSDEATAPSKGDSTRDSNTPSFGQLTEIQSDVFESTAGLIYGKGSEDGHRLKHIMKHAEDSPGKKIHGVFDGERDEILAMIDDAWTRHKKNDSTVRSSLQNNRIVITAKMKDRIGYVGGEEGERKGHPECRYLRIVIDKPNRIVTAYPVQSW